MTESSSDELLICVRDQRVNGLFKGGRFPKGILPPAPQGSLVSAHVRYCGASSRTGSQCRVGPAWRAEGSAVGNEEKKNIFPAKVPLP